MKVGGWNRSRGLEDTGTVRENLPLRKSRIENSNEQKYRSLAGKPFAKNIELTQVAEICNGDTRGKSMAGETRGDSIIAWWRWSQAKRRNPVLYFICITNTKVQFVDCLSD
ncbi:hypothetical protein CEXT_240121 [Caerostris extrusa]|uniref:Uncharacterized protein n=1 Tax=Caerostris extrusa TaxID=172846 RepID=A0AAV4PWN9_CAEEX|nr:hypothetical protein CEXT_240121 [Caerostris extrusa]